MESETVRIRISPADDYGTLEFDPDPSRAMWCDPEVPVETLRRWERAVADWEAMQAELAEQYAGVMARIEADEQAHPEKYGTGH